MPDSNDYWPANIADSNLTTPATILKEQAALLGEKTRPVILWHTLLQELRRVAAGMAEALEKVKTLSGLLPICAWCKRIRDDKGYWSQVEKYVHEHTGADFTHGICPECLEKQRPKKQPAE